MQKVKDFIKSIELRWSDLFLGLFVLTGIPICFESNNLMDNANLTTLRAPFFVFVLIFLTLMIFLFFYLFFEHKKGYKTNLILAFLLVIFIIIQAETIFLTPNVVNTTITGNDGNIIKVTTYFTTETKAIHFFAFCYLILDFYIGIFIFAKRVKSINFIVWFSYAFYLFALVVLIYSVITEDYVLILKDLFGNTFDIYSLSENAVSGIFKNTIIYALFLECGIGLSLISFSISKKKHHLIITLLFYFHLYFTVCKMGLLISTIVLFMYSACYIVLVFFRKNKKDAIKGLILLFVLLTIAISILICCFCVEEIRDRILVLFNDGNSIVGRYKIWQIGTRIIGSTSLLHGYGYGIYNSILVNNIGYWGSHSWFISILGRCGFFGVFAYLIILVIHLYLIFSKDKQNKIIKMSFLFVLILLFLHSFIEDSYYIVINVLILSTISINSENKKGKV